MSVDAGTKKEFSAYFGDIAALSDQSIVEKLLSLKQIFSISSEDLYIKWEQFVNRAQKDLDIDLVSLDEFQKHLQASITVVPTKLTPSAIAPRKPVFRPSGFSSSPVGPSTPNLKRRKLDDVESSPVTFETANNTFTSPGGGQVMSKLINQQDSHTLIETLNPQIDESKGYEDLKEDTVKPFKLVNNFDASKFKFRTMAMKLLESADVLDEQIDLMSELYKSANESVQFGNPCLSSQAEILCCGRIVADSPTYDKLPNHSLNSTSLFIETSRMDGIGQRVSLDLSKLPEYSLFAGQIVILKGSNPTGKSFIVQQVVDPPELGATLSSHDELKEYEELVGENGLKCLVAAGPFSNQQTLNYLKLEGLVEKINEDIKPHIVLLYGPFIDIENQSVVSGEIEVKSEQQPRSLDDLFRQVFTPIIKKINPKIQVILIPSLRDTSIKHASYPQDSFDRKKFGLPKNVRIYPNPSSFSANEVIFGGSNLDVYKDLRDVYKSSENGKIPSNRFDRITQHILQQRRYYPAFPGLIRRNIFQSKEDMNKSYDLQDGLMAEELSSTTVGGSCLEVPYLALTEFVDSLPDILIIPSELKYFARVTKGVVVINPGSYIKPNKDASKEDGSYVVLSIKGPMVSNSTPNNVEELKDGLYYHNVGKRTRVDIFKS